MDNHIEKLKELKNSLTYDQISKITGVSKPTIVRWLLGTAKPSQAHLRILAATLK